MGYETKLFVGQLGMPSDELAHHKNMRLETDKQSAYYPLKKKNGQVVKTGRKQTFFQIMAMVDMCKMGYDAKISNLDRTNNNHDDFVYFYHDDVQIYKDRYGDYMKPIPIQDVIDALKEDVKVDDYRRYNWALALLEQMNKSGLDLYVLLYGY